jgi:hypothetical protein
MDTRAKVYWENWHPPAVLPVCQHGINQSPDITDLKKFYKLIYARHSGDETRAIEEYKDATSIATKPFAKCSECDKYKFGIQDVVDFYVKKRRHDEKDCVECPHCYGEYFSDKDLLTYIINRKYDGSHSKLIAEIASVDRKELNSFLINAKLKKRRREDEEAFEKARKKAKEAYDKIDPEAAESGDEKGPEDAKDSEEPDEMEDEPDDPEEEEKTKGKEDSDYKESEDSGSDEEEKDDTDDGDE